MRPFDVLLGATQYCGRVMGREARSWHAARGKARRHRAVERRPRDQYPQHTERSLRVMKAGRWIDTGLPGTTAGQR